MKTVISKPFGLFWGCLWASLSVKTFWILKPYAELNIHICHVPKFQNHLFGCYRDLSWTNLGCFCHARGTALESNILNFKILLHNFTSMSLNFRTIRPVVTEISVRQNLGRKKKKRKNNNNNVSNNKSNKYNNKSNKNKKKQIKNNKSPHFIICLVDMNMFANFDLIPV